MHRFKYALKNYPLNLDNKKKENWNESDLLIFSAIHPIEDTLKKLNVNEKGITHREALLRLKQYGFNEVVKEKKINWLKRLLKNFTDPLSVLLLVLALISFLTNDLKATFLILAMVAMSVSLRFIQETKADLASEKLKAMVKTETKVVRDGKEKEIELKYLVPGDIVHLSAGDMVPADIRIITSKDLFVNQSTLTGESVPSEKHGDVEKKDLNNPLESVNLCFLGTSIESGSAVALVLSTGSDTYFGSLAADIVGTETPSNFENGIKSFTWLIMKFIIVMGPLVFFLNVLSKGRWFEAFLFAIAVTIGLTPEMLPMIVAVNLSNGALKMSKKKVIVKHLDAIQNFGAMDILCSDKTGTITQGKVVLVKYLDINGTESKQILEYAYLNSHYQTGLNNLIDVAILGHNEIEEELNTEKNFQKVDEIPFDFIRRRMSVIVRCQKEGENVLICKGATEEVLALCKNVKVKDKIIALRKSHHEHKKNLEIQMNDDGFRVMAVAYKKLPELKTRYSKEDESEMTLLGFLAFLDPPKDTAAEAIKDLKEYGVHIKVLTGDNEIVTRKVCHDVGMSTDNIILGSQMDKMTDVQLGVLAEKVSIFAKLAPFHKERIINVLRQRGHVVGFLGDGINDAPALKAADVGISVDSAADIAKESSDIILMEKSLRVLREGVKDGRSIFGNIVKYIQMAASSNFGNMFSVLGGSVFLPFLPMLPIQVLTNNILYDISQTSIPTDKTDEEYLKKPRQWRIDHIRRFIFFIGPISSLFDYATYFVMLMVFNSWNNPALFHTGWFVESLLSQTLIIYVIRTNKIPFIQSSPSKPLLLTTLAIAGIGAYLPYSFLAKALGFVPLPPLYWLILFVMLFAYAVITQLIKTWFNKKYEL